MNRRHFIEFRSAQTIVELSLATLAIAGCAILPISIHTNSSLADAPMASKPPRATLNIDASRGNPRSLVFLALSGGGSRSAFFASEIMLKLQTVYETDLLEQVDAISAVSGGALPAAYYALTRDESIRLPNVTNEIARALPALGSLSANPVEGTITCSAPLQESSAAALAALLGDHQGNIKAVVDLCDQTTHSERRIWNRDTVRSLMTRNYVLRMTGSFFLPTNVLRYWFTPFDRSDIMAQTLADNLFDTPVFGRDLTLGELNPKRPFLVLNSTNASAQGDPLFQNLKNMPFGTVFTFTQDDFYSALCSDVSNYSVARAVMASSAFPFVFPTMTLRDYRPQSDPACLRPTSTKPLNSGVKRYMHVFDGGNSDNLGLKGVKRALLQAMAKEEGLSEIDSIVVLLVDAFTTPRGTSRELQDPRGPFDFFLDSNVIAATDSLLRQNRTRSMDNFDRAEFNWDEDCKDATRELPESLCDLLISKNVPNPLRLREKLVFYHIGFDDVRDHDQLFKRLNEIPTTFSISAESVDAIERASNLIVATDNPCLRKISELLGKQRANPNDVHEVSSTCSRFDKKPNKAVDN